MDLELFTFWSGKIGPLEKLCLESFSQFDIKLSLYTYAEISDISPKLVQKDASQIIDYKIFERYLKAGLLTAFANRFRYQLISWKDSCWVDADILCNSNFRTELEKKFIFGFESKKIINNAVLRIPSSSQLSKNLLKRAEIIDTHIKYHGQTGPKLLTKEICRLGLKNYASPIQTYYPISFLEVWQLWDPLFFESVQLKFENSSAMHLWAYVMNIGNANPKLWQPHPKSFLGHQYRLHGIQNSNLPELPLEIVRTDLRYLPGGNRGRVKRFLSKLDYENR